MIEWDIVSIKTLPFEDGFENVVRTVLWGITAYSAVIPSLIANNMGEVILSAPSNNFVPMDELTKEEVIFWVKSTLGPEAVSIIETDILDRLSDLETRGVPVPLPWV